MLRGPSGLWFALLALALGPGAPPAAGEGDGPEPTDDSRAFLEFLGDEDTASDDWNHFFDSLPERPEDADRLLSDRVAAEEAQP